MIKAVPAIVICVSPKVMVEPRLICWFKIWVHKADRTSVEPETPGQAFQKTTSKAMNPITHKTAPKA
jgi:hypothetical protein